ncbi:hypothetical protein R5R35_003808 [Gryllus longicercus]|uniref:N-acetylglucosaminylphosphatidylinositol deacetylase n=1 Tax=Gryllus longicercus TaxID=2509291 RepID=A0AAN9VA64_9ORTH
MIDIYPLQRRLEEWKDLVIEETLQYAWDTMQHLLYAVGIYIFLCGLVYIATVYLRNSSDCGQLRSVKRVLFVIAHPDDECMFFGPIIITLAQRHDCQMFLLCLSNGDFRNEGKQRKSELWKSCKILGIPEDNITLCKCSHLPDSPTVEWREDVVANLILNHIESLSIDTVITFDKGGVSRHINHSSIFYAAAYLCMERKLPSYCRAYALESICLVRKYSAILDVPISYLLSSYWYIISLRERDIILSAMEAHASQFIWFRKLYMFFSRYTVMNTLKEIELVDLELDLELDD